MAKKLKDLMAELSAEDRRDVRQRARLHIRAMEDAERLDQIRKAADRNQSEVARLMGIGQNAVSQLEKRDDLQLSTLHRYVTSLGLRLELAVVSASGERAVLRNYQPWRGMGTAAGKAVRAAQQVAPGKKAPAGTASDPQKAVASKGAIRPPRSATRKAAKNR
ncbi:helix-turn-helix domain-containing protein [Ramlibacter henchirensis]|uniref:Helix-turn-helix domain-containing protein n=1 Tax=Ramlibacter henchirensis TaxID=204072 RepID=A0A4Z0BM75_9BURK|nr:helix-turn-helix domain-containing protein [Ramlibacter henchirensis]TFY99194.1 helix-turn-helix domain-containing protein [Ramlibacter henchirensis]